MYFHFQYNNPSCSALQCPTLVPRRPPLKSHQDLWVLRHRPGLLLLPEVDVLQRRLHLHHGSLSRA